MKGVNIIKNLSSICSTKNMLTTILKENSQEVGVVKRENSRVQALIHHSTIMIALRLTQTQLTIGLSLKVVYTDFSLLQI